MLKSESVRHWRISGFHAWTDWRDFCNDHGLNYDWQLARLGYEEEGHHVFVVGAFD